MGFLPPHQTQNRHRLVAERSEHEQERNTWHKRSPGSLDWTLLCQSTGELTETRAPHGAVEF